jgi:hypothetical protein
VKKVVTVVEILLVLGLAACAAEDNAGGGGTADSGTAAPETPTTAPTSATSEPAPAPEGSVYVSLGDSWAEGAHCNGCRTFPQIHAAALENTLGQPVTFVDLAGQAQPFFNTPGGGGSAGLLHALRSEEWFRDEVAKGDIIMIETGSNDGGEIFEPIMDGTCGGKHDTGCVVPLAAKWKREFHAILDEIEDLRGERPTAIRLVNSGDAFLDPTFSAPTLRGFEAFFEELTVALCDTAEAHDVVCVDVRPVLNGPDFEQPLNDGTQEAMDAVARLLIQTGVPELK